MLSDHCKIMSSGVCNDKEVHLVIAQNITLPQNTPAVVIHPSQPYKDSRSFELTNRRTNVDMTQQFSH
jgi:hypothetical protein